MQKSLENKLLNKYRTSEHYIFKLIISYLDFTFIPKETIVKTVMKELGLITYPEQKYTCICGKIIKPEYLYGHIEHECSAHNKKCLDCDITFENKQTLINHKVFTCFGQEIKCIFCNYSVHKYGLKYSHYQKCKKCFYCIECDGYYRLENLGLHQYYHFN